MNLCPILFVDRQAARTAAIRGYLQRFDLAIGLALEHPKQGDETNSPQVLIHYGSQDTQYGQYLIVLDHADDVKTWQQVDKPNNQHWVALLPPDVKGAGLDDGTLKQAGFDQIHHLPLHEQDYATVFANSQLSQLKQNADAVLNAISLLDDSSAQAAAMGDAELVQELRAMLRDDIVQRRQQLAKELSHNEISEAAETVHRLVGGCAYCGAKALQSASLALENCLRQRELESLDEHYGRWLRACDQLLPALN